MSDLATVDAYGVQTEPLTVRIQRLLPAAPERVWAYLTESDLRRQWLASGPMDLVPGGEMDLTWRNDELSDVVEPRPAQFPAEHAMSSKIVAVDPPRLLSFTWMAGEVSFELTREGQHTLLTVTHQRISEPGAMLNVSAGWHTHLDILAARIAGRAPGPFWSTWAKLRDEYEARLG